MLQENFGGTHDYDANNNDSLIENSVCTFKFINYCLLYFSFLKVYIQLPFLQDKGTTKESSNKDSCTTSRSLPVIRKIDIVTSTVSIF